MDLNSIKELYLKRQSCREFSEAPLEKETVKTICETALLAPSARNAQPWKLVVLTGKEKEEIAPSLQRLGMNKFLSKAGALVAVTGTESKGNEFVMHDLGILTAHLVLAAEAEGVGSCIIGWRDENKLRAALHLPDEARVPVVVALGYPAEGYPVREKKRKPLAETLEFLD